jgi:hypothetical protein
MILILPLALQSAVHGPVTFHALPNMHSERWQIKY